MDRWHPHRINQKIPNHFGLRVNRVRHKPHVQAKYNFNLKSRDKSKED